MVYTVTFNPSLDYIVDVNDFQTGKVNRTYAEKILPGGKGINVSIVLSNLGVENQALGFVSGFTGEVLKALLDKYGLKTSFIDISEGMTRINVKLRSNEESEINGLGPDIKKENIDELYEKLSCLEEDDILILAGSIPASMPSSIYYDIMKHLKDKKIKVIVDATKELLLNVLPLKPFLVKPNNHELGEMFNTKVSTKEEVIKYGKKLVDMGARNVLVSMAGDGAVLIAEDGQIYQSEAPKGKVVNSVGAGDSMVAGFTAGYLLEKTYDKAFAMGVCTGSASAFSEELAKKDEVEELLKKYF